MEWKEICELLCQEKPQFQEVSLGATTQLGDIVFEAIIVAPPYKKFTRDGPSVFERTTIRGLALEQRMSSATTKRLEITPYP